MLNKQGKIFVFEGVDASGKGTQSKLLYEFLKKNNYQTFYLDFPQYDTYYGQLVAKFLRGELGNLDSVSPYFAALAFALDRFAVKKEIKKELERGSMIVANRYVTSNMAHQAAKFDSKKDKDEFIKWIEKLEYQEHGLPKENVVIYLDVFPEISTKLLNTKGERNYLKNTKDIQEQDLDYQKKTLEMYKSLAQKRDNWITISCMKDGALRSIADIHQEILEVLKNKGLI